MPWFRKDGEMKAGEEKLDDVEFKPEKLKEDITAEFDSKFKTYQTEQDAKMKPLLDMASNLEADRVAKAKIAREAADKKTAENNEVDENDFLIDPVESVRKLQEPQTKLLVQLASRQARTEILGDEKYYYGDIKTKVDAMIDSQPMNQRVDPNMIRNAYKLVMYDHQQDITDGKIKARNTGAIFESNGTGGHSGNDKGDAIEDWSKDEEFVASKMGINKTDWIKNRKELSFV